MTQMPDDIHDKTCNQTKLWISCWLIQSVRAKVVTNPPRRPHGSTLHTILSPQKTNFFSGASRLLVSLADKCVALVYSSLPRLLTSFWGQSDVHQLLAPTFFSILFALRHKINARKFPVFAFIYLSKSPWIYLYCLLTSYGGFCTSFPFSYCS